MPANAGSEHHMIASNGCCMHCGQHAQLVVNGLENALATSTAALAEANARIEAMEPFQSGWEEPDVRIVALTNALAEAEKALRMWHDAADLHPLSFNSKYGFMPHKWELDKRRAEVLARIAAAKTAEGPNA
jgi:hypothetical protein